MSTQKPLVNLTTLGIEEQLMFNQNELLKTQLYKLIKRCESKLKLTQSEASSSPKTVKPLKRPNSSKLRLGVKRIKQKLDGSVGNYTISIENQIRSKQMMLRQQSIEVSLQSKLTSKSTKSCLKAIRRQKNMQDDNIE